MATPRKRSSSSGEDPNSSGLEPGRSSSRADPQGGDSLSSVADTSAASAVAQAALDAAQVPSVAAMAGLAGSEIRSAVAQAALDAAQVPSVAAMAGLAGSEIRSAVAQAALDAAQVPSVAAMAGLAGSEIRSAVAMAALDAAKLPSAAELFGLTTSGIGASYAAMLQSQHEQPGLKEWAEALDQTLGSSTSPKPRAHRGPSDFYAAFEVKISSVSDLLKALAVVQQKNSQLGLVWRGQQVAEWPVDSSLTRRLRDGGHDLGEKEMIAVERFQIHSADRWAVPHLLGDLNFLAELQHEGAPTRLIDVSLDPEVAVWFAVQESDKHEDKDGRLLSWGRLAAPRRNEYVRLPEFLPSAGGDAFWQQWTDHEMRRSNDWGTGKSVRSWQPAAMNERMRAQRAAFLFDAEPVIEKDLLVLFDELLAQSWKANEIADATRIVGLPSRHDIKAMANTAGIVPMFSFRIESKAKPAIRTYLEGKGLVEESIYPDRAGLIAYLRRMSVR
jgi:hypothetical protein